MKRTDSGFHESILWQNPGHAPALIVRSNTAPSRRNAQKSALDSMSQVQNTSMDSQRPASENRLRPAHERSKTSASETSTARSKNRGHGSKPSSRRTSCTIIERSRHYRMQSSNAVPAATRQDIDDVYALHHRSYSLFQNPSLHSKSGLPSPTLSHADQFGFPSAASRFSVDGANMFAQDALPKQSEETIYAAEQPNTTMHWTSPCTRRREYDRIDKANSGIRGFLNKVMPRCVSGPQEKFYEKDQSDAGSVRRYRMDDDANTMAEKELARSPSHATKQSASMKKRWICF